jgi:hypothetical protein
MNSATSRNGILCEGCEGSEGYGENFYSQEGSKNHYASI